jgi:hypothetical protein
MAQSKISTDQVQAGGTASQLLFNNADAVDGVPGFTWDVVQAALTLDPLVAVASPGSLWLKATDASGANVGGQVNIRSGGSATGNAGDINIAGAYATAAAANGGSVRLDGGWAIDGTPGEIRLTAGTATGTGVGASAIIEAGGATGGESGGDLELYGGSSSGVGTGDGGSILLTAGGTTTGGSGGSVEIFAGQSASNAGGSVNIFGGVSGTNIGGGTVQLNGGDGDGAQQVGRIILNGGINSGTPANSGGVTVRTNNTDRFQITASGVFLVGNAAGLAGQVLTSNGSALPPTWEETASANAPGTSTSTGRAGQVAYDSGFIYVCIATDTWRRAAIAAGW